MLKKKEKKRAGIEKLLIRVRKKNKPRKKRGEKEEQLPKIALGETVQLLNMQDNLKGNAMNFVQEQKADED